MAEQSNTTNPSSSSKCNEIDGHCTSPGACSSASRCQQTEENARYLAHERELEKLRDALRSLELDITKRMGPPSMATHGKRLLTIIRAALADGDA